MTASALVFARLSASAALAALVGQGIYPVVVPQGKPFPAVRYQLITRRGDSNRAGCGPDTAQIQVSVYAASYDLLETVEVAVRQALDGYSNGDEEITCTNATDLFEEQQLLFHRAVDYTVTVPAPDFL
jgi:hypothetical protein